MSDADERLRKAAEAVVEIGNWLKVEDAGGCAIDWNKYRTALIERVTELKAALQAPQPTGERERPSDGGGVNDEFGACAQPTGEEEDDE